MLNKAIPTLKKNALYGIAAMIGLSVHATTLFSQGTVDIEETKVQGRKTPTVENIRNPSYELEAEELERTSSRNLEDALLTVPGVQARSRGGDDVRLSIRGSGLQNVVFTKARGVDVRVDGFPIGGADGNFGYGLFSPIFAKDIEVYPGAGANALGSLTLGGALNLKTPTGGEVTDRVRFDVGSFDYFRLAASTGFAGEKTDGAVQFEVRDEEGFRDFSENDAQKLAANYGFRISDRATNRIFLNAARVDQEVALPIRLEELEDNPEQGRVNGPPGNLNVNQLTQPFYETQNLRLADRFRYQSGPDQQIELGAYYLYRDVDFRRPSLPPPPFSFNFGPGWLEARSHDVGANFSYENSAEQLNRPNTFTADLRVSSMFGYEELYPNLNTVKGPKFADGDLSANNLVLSLENTWSWTDRLDLLLGLQAFYSERNYEDNFNTGAAKLDRDQDYRDLAPRIGFEYSATETVDLFGSLSRTIEPPAFGDIISIPVPQPMPPRPLLPARQPIEIQDLDAQKATVLELGLRGKSDDFSWQATAYYSWLRNEILRFAPPGDVNTVGNQTGINADKTRHMGLELSFDWTFWRGAGAPTAATDNTDRLSLFGQYTLRSHEFDDDDRFGDNELAGVAPQLLYLELLYENADGWYLGPNIGGRPEDVPLDNANSVEIDGFLLFGAKAGWMGENWGIFVEGRNLTDEEFAPNFFNVVDAGGNDNGSNLFPGEGRGFNLGVKYRW